MKRHNKALLISPSKAFCEHYTLLLEQCNFQVLRANSLTAVNLKSNESIELCLVDNCENQFPYGKLFEYLKRHSPQTVVVNVGAEQKLRPVDGHYLYQCQGDHIPLDSFLINLNEFFRRAKSRTDLAAMLIHDIRSPLHSMLAYIELLLNQTFGAVNEGQKNFLEKAMVLGDQVLDIIEDINEIYKSEQYIFSLEKGPFDLSPVIDQALLSLWIQADRKDIQIIKEISPDLPEIIGDAFQIQRVFVNLVGNAIKYCPKRSKIWIRAQQTSQRQIEIEVKDNGNGIPEEDLNRIFRKAFRVRPHAEHHKGYGLGLYICKIIVKAHGGTIRVENNEMGGVSFTFSLPVKTE